MISVLLPVGMPGGINSGFPDIPNGWGTIRFGDHLEHVDRLSYRLWRHATAGLSRDELIAWGTSDGIGYAKLLVEELLQPGLLIDLDSTDDAHLKSLLPVGIGECEGNGAQISP